MKNPIYTLLAFVLKLVLKNPVVFGSGNISGTAPSIFISNHDGFFAPVYLMLFANQNFVPWVVYENFHIRLCMEYIRKDFVEPTWGLNRPLSSIVAAVISPICVGLMKYVDAIPVYHSSKHIMDTIDNSIHELEQGRNLLIFPENPKDNTEPYIRKFQTGFVQLAKILYEKNQKTVHFYPIYVNRHTCQIWMDSKIIFNPTLPFHQERDRILTELRERMLVMRIKSETSPIKADIGQTESEKTKKPE